MLTIRTDIPVGQQIKELCKDNDIKMFKICDKVGMTQATLSKMINKNPKSIEIMILLFQELEKEIEKRKFQGE
jgi:transcriptional regulator with XRE-family HTH domain